MKTGNCWEDGGHLWNYKKDCNFLVMLAGARHNYIPSDFILNCSEAYILLPLSLCPNASVTIQYHSELFSIYSFTVSLWFHYSPSPKLPGATFTIQTVSAVQFAPTLAKTHRNAGEYLRNSELSSVISSRFFFEFIFIIRTLLVFSLNFSDKDSSSKQRFRSSWWERDSRIFLVLWRNRAYWDP